MLRQRKKKPSNSLEELPHKNIKKNKAKTYSFKLIYYLSGVAIIGFISTYLAYNKYQKFSLITSNELPKVSDGLGFFSNKFKFWGSYRPNVYFGLKSKSPSSLLFGIMWYTHLSNGKIMPIRHWCEQEDKLTRYGWLYHDGENFGEHEVIDNFYGILSSFVKHPIKDDKIGWTIKMNIQNLPHIKFNDTISMIVYVFRESSVQSGYVKDEDTTPNTLKKNLMSIERKPDLYHSITGYDPSMDLNYRFSFKSSTRKSSHESGNTTTNYLKSEIMYGSLLEKFPLKTSGAAAQLTKHVYDNLVMMRGGDLDRHDGESDIPVITLPDISALQRNTIPMPAEDKYEGFDFVAYQVIPSTLPLQIDVAFETVDPINQNDHFSETNDNTANIDKKFEVHGTRLSQLKKQFDQKFRSIFIPAASVRAEQKFTNPDDVSVLRATFSNLIGGMGYFYGRSLVSPTPTLYIPSQMKDKKEGEEEIMPYFPVELFTAVPSRSFFPRGFLWDEGFHQIILAHWNPSLSMDAIASWLDTLNRKGWIPREQILGAEARAKVPREFLVQRDKNANPPALFLALEHLLRLAPPTLLPTSNLKISVKNSVSKAHQLKILHFWVNAFPRLYSWYNWFNMTQIGLVPSTYRWRGRDPYALELNPKTLTSGLDDYPRTSHPSAQDRNVDLRCWMGYGVQVLANIAQALRAFTEEYREFIHDKNDQKQHFDDIYDDYKEISKLVDTASKHLNKYDKNYNLRNSAAFLSLESDIVRWHWNAEAKMFSDYGLHAPETKLVQSDLSATANPGQQNNPKTMQRIIPPGSPRLNVRFTGRETFGYVSLFPMFFKFLSLHSPQLTQILAIDLPDPELLWTPYGLRSLSKSSTIFYDKYNTEHDPPYWRGDIWININYLALGSLKHYGNLELGNETNDIQRKSASTNKVLASNLYNKLRSNVLSNVISQYRRSGYIWERYNDKTGRGKGAHPFTGWSALITLILAEIY